MKVAPDLTFEALDEILELVGPRQLAGLVATNTTTTRPDTSDLRLKQVYAENGGLSGRPLRARSTEVIRYLHRQTRGAVPLIGVGGIASAADAWEKITAGASLLQVYSGLVHGGPGLVRDLVQGLRWRLEVEGFERIAGGSGGGSAVRTDTANPAAANGSDPAWTTQIYFNTLKPSHETAKSDHLCAEPEPRPASAGMCGQCVSPVSAAHGVDPVG